MTGEIKKTAEASTSQTITEEQVKFLAECEEDFKDRYTDADAEFMLVKENSDVTPPVLDPWYNKPRRNFNWTDHRDRGDRSRDDRRRNDHEGGGYRQHRQNQERQQNQDRNNQRHNQSHGDRFYYY